MSKRIGIDGAIVFGLAYAASLYALRANEATQGYYGKAQPPLTPSLDAIDALRQWVFSRKNESAELEESKETTWPTR